MQHNTRIIITWPPPGRSRPPRPVPAGRHRSSGTPRHRTRLRPVTRGRWRQPAGRHRRAAPRRALAASYAGLLALLGVVATSGWFTASGAAAAAQMLF